MKRIFTSLLPVCLALVSFGAVADGVEGASTTGNTLVDSVNLWASLISTQATIPAGSNACAVTCAATFINPGANTDANYELGIGNNSFVPHVTSRQIISFPEEESGLDDHNWGPIATTTLFSGVSGTDTFRCLARRSDTDTDPTEVERASITVVCGPRI